MSFFSKLKEGLQKTATAIGRTFTSVFTDVKNWDDSTFTEMERTLLASDFGPAASQKIVADIRNRYKLGEIKSSEDAREVAAAAIATMLTPGARPLRTAENGPTVILFLGVNGSGKTTSIGKLACQWTKQGKKVMLAACDTFRAAAIDQLEVWTERAGVDIVKHAEGSDPGAVVYDALEAAKARNCDVVIIDTAGRLHNKKNLMDELAKINRIIDTKAGDCSREVLLVLDATTGQNAVNQAKLFSETAPISGIVLTKLDGTAKGGIVISIKNELGIPVKLIGVGEKIDDLQPFDSRSFVEALFGDIETGTADDEETEVSEVSEDYEEYDETAEDSEYDDEADSEDVESDTDDAASEYESDDSDDAVDDDGEADSESDTETYDEPEYDDTPAADDEDEAEDSDSDDDDDESDGEDDESDDDEDEDDDSDDDEDEDDDSEDEDDSDDEDSDDEKAEEEEKPKKKGFFKRLFGRKDKDDE